MAEEPSPGKRTLSPGAISAWISLGGTIGSILTSLAQSSQSIYNPVDTALVFISILAFPILLWGSLAIYSVGMIRAVLLGQDPSAKMWPHVVVIIIVIVLVVPEAIEFANLVVRNDMSKFQLTLLRFVGVGALVLCGRLVHKHL